MAVDDDAAAAIPMPPSLEPTPSAFRAWVEQEALMIIGLLAATGVISGGFVLGLHRRKARELHELERERTRKGSKKIVVAKPVARKKLPTGVTWWERAIGVKSSKMSAAAAARSALIGGTVLATAGTGVIVLGIAAASGVSSYSDFHSKMSVMVPRFRKNVGDFFGIVPKAGPTPEQLEQDRQDMALLVSIFSEEEKEN